MCKREVCEMYLCNVSVCECSECTMNEAWPGAIGGIRDSTLTGSSHNHLVMTGFLAQLRCCYVLLSVIRYTRPLFVTVRPGNFYVRLKMLPHTVSMQPKN